MKVEYLPLLQIQRDLYSMPADHERFRTYLKTILNQEATDVDLMPLVTMNPMGKAHVATMLDTLLEMKADVVADQIVSDVTAQLTDYSSTFKLGLVVADDLMGGWTNRYTTEFNARFNLSASLKRNWLTGILWTSESPSLQKVREEALIPVYRAVYMQQHGMATTLQEMLAQEGYAMAMAGCQSPSLSEDDMAYTYEVIAPHLSTQDHPIIIACLFGDRAAHSLGYKPQGLSDRAGFAMALAQHRTSVKDTR
ncbi:MAG: hypothetical protein AAGA46_15745 [Cyanobacteria bacterium P01_F01_bin.13]